ncbi:MAG: hypothetical protein LBR78_03080 [Holosporales bacterium]|jgi:hypothetical protein|nr:hypothetical protein [Holosporales bacterium]
MEIGALLKMLNRRITKVIAIANEREETLREIRMMVNRCGNMHFFRQAVIERIYDTAWTINGRPVLGRTEGWRWSEIGTDDTTHGTGGQVTIITQAYANGRRAPLQWATVGRTQEDYYYDGVMRGPQTGARIDWLCTAANIPLLPKHKKGEMAIITFYTDSSYSPSPEWQGDWGGGHIVEAMTLEKSVSVTSGLTGIQMYTFNMTRGEGYYALLELPVSRALRTTIDNPGDGYTLGMPRGMRWRAIVGEYVAP